MPGGVCAVLDYDVELMAEYVAEMTTRLALDNATPAAPFRKFISQILSSTRLPSTTILLGMNYFAKRINTMAANPTRTKMSDGQVWRLLTVALLLGSKFLDDNTFQNRSWSEVSGIAVRELNALEHEWMDAIAWNLYVNLDRSADYNAWLKSWQDWSETKKRQQAMSTRDRLASLVPIDTEAPRRPAHNYSTWHQQQVAEYERLSSMKRNEQPQQRSYRPRESSWSSYQPAPVAWSNPPVSPPDSGYGTPDYLNSATSVNSHYNDWFGQQANRAVTNNAYSRQHQQQLRQPQQPQQQQQPPHQQQPQQQQQQVSNHIAFQSRNYPPYNFYGHNIWEHNIADCNCLSCTSAHNKQPYFGMAHNFGQPVMG